MKRLRILLLIASLAAMNQVMGASAVQQFTARVVAVLDGDTLLVMRGDKPVKLRLAEIDAPEVAHAGGSSQEAQPYGTASQKSLADMVMGRQVQVESRAVDDYGRIVASVSVDGLNVNREQVRRGLAWEYSRFHSNRELVAVQREAQLARRGMWAGSDNIEPSQWRKLHPFAPSAVSGSQVVGRRANGAECSERRHCSDMASCEEARRYFALCGGEALDGDRDGKPCESLCTSGAVRWR